MREGYKKSQKKIKKPLDKLPSICYNKDTKENNNILLKKGMVTQ